MRAIWKGTLELGDLAIPVGLASTVKDGGEHFRRLHTVCMKPAVLRDYCATHEQLLDPEDIVHGWELTPGEFIPITGDARQALEPIETRRMPVHGFVPSGDLHPALVKKLYQLVPSTTVGIRAYLLLAAAIADLGVTGLARFVWRSEQLGAITSRGGGLEIATLHFGEDLVDLREEIRALGDIVDPIPAQLQELARELVDRHTRPLNAAVDLASLDRPRTRRVLEQLLAGEEIIRQPMQEDERPVTIDLEATLRRSIKQAPRKPRARKRAPTNA